MTPAAQTGIRSGRGPALGPSRPLPVGGSRAAPLAATSRDSAPLAIVLVVGLLLIGMALDIGLLALSASLAALMVAVSAPATGLLMIALISPLRQPDVIPTPGLPTLLVGAVLLGSVLRLPIDRPRLRVGLPLALLGAFVFYVGVQQLPEMMGAYTGEVGHLVGYQFVQLTTAFGLVVAAGWVLPGRDPRPYLAAGIASAMLTGLIAIVTYDNPAVHPALERLLATNDIETRVAGSFGNPNYFGVFQAVAATTAIGWLSVSRSGRLRLLLLGAAGISCLAVALTMSRGAIVAALAGIAVVAFMRHRFAGMGVVVAVLIGALLLYPAFVQWRLGDATGTVASQALAGLAESDGERLASVLAGPRIFATAPIFGVSFGHYSFVSAEFSGNQYATAAHNWYVNVLAEQGIAGAVIWGLFLVAIVLALRRRPREAQIIGYGVLAVVAVGSLFLEPPTSFKTVALPIIVVAAALAADWTRVGPAAAARPRVGR